MNQAWTLEKPFDMHGDRADSQMGLDCSWDYPSDVARVLEKYP
jgi:hypothetical protein